MSLEDNKNNKISEPSPDGPLRSGTVLVNRYRIESLIKAGGMGAVYKAVDIRLNSTCAVKELISTCGTEEERKKATEWFEREVKLLARLNHTGLPEVFDYFITEGIYYFVLTFVEGEDLLSILEKEGKPGLPEDRVIEWTKEILKILDYLHNQSPPVIYRDIKPGNIMLNKEGKIILVDFGIARIIKDKRTQTIIGSEGYAAPEQYKGKALPASDIYSLGATVWHLLTGEEPFPFRFEEIRKILPNISPEFSRILMKSLEDRPENRFAGAKEMLLALDFKRDIKTFQMFLSGERGSWKARYTGSEASLRSIYFVDNYKGWAAGYGDLFGGILLRTKDGGRNWIMEKKGGFSGVHFINSREGCVVGGGVRGGLILHTEDGGKTWKKKKCGFLMPLINRVYFINNAFGWAVGDRGLILRTTDGGRNWKKQRSNTPAELVGLYFINPDTGWITGKDGVILHTEDGGETWNRQKSNTSLSLWSIYFPLDRKGWVAGNRSTILYTEDGGNSWEKYTGKISLSLDGIKFQSPHLRSICFTDELNGWIVGEKGVFLYTGDGGKSWIPVTGITSENLYDVYFYDSSNGWAAGDKGSVFKYCVE